MTLKFRKKVGIEHMVGVPKTNYVFSYPDPGRRFLTIGRTVFLLPYFRKTGRSGECHGVLDFRNFPFFWHRQERGIEDGKRNSYNFYLKKGLQINILLHYSRPVVDS